MMLLRWTLNISSNSVSYELPNVSFNVVHLIKIFRSLLTADNFRMELSFSFLTISFFLIEGLLTWLSSIKYKMDETRFQFCKAILIGRYDRSYWFMAVSHSRKIFNLRIFLQDWNVAIRQWLIVVILVKSPPPSGGSAGPLTHYYPLRLDCL